MSAPHQRGWERLSQALRAVRSTAADRPVEGVAGAADTSDRSQPPGDPPAPGPDPAELDMVMKSGVLEDPEQFRRLLLYRNMPGLIGLTSTTVKVVAGAVSLGISGGGLYLLTSGELNVAAYAALLVLVVVVAGASVCAVALALRSWCRAGSRAGGVPVCAAARAGHPCPAHDECGQQTGAAHQHHHRGELEPDYQHRTTPLQQPTDE